jgi:hypothetical protein
MPLARGRIVDRQPAPLVELNRPHLLKQPWLGRVPLGQKFICARRRRAAGQAKKRVRLFPQTLRQPIGRVPAHRFVIGESL